MLRRSGPCPLTTREIEVLERLARGDSTAEVCARLGISERTAQEHVRHARLKLGARTRTAAVAVAIRRGWI